MWNGDDLRIPEGKRQDEGWYAARGHTSPLSRGNASVKEEVYDEMAG
jgi:hypothetical protein